MAGGSVTLAIQARPQAVHPAVATGVAGVTSRLASGAAGVWAEWGGIGVGVGDGGFGRALGGVGGWG